MRKPAIELTEEMKALEKREQPNIVAQTRQYKLITPLFGGGVEPNQMDEVTPVRGTAVRGHLRFWWRAMRGGQEQFGGSIEKMKAKEDEIWGLASTVSKVSLSISYPDEASRKGRNFQDTHKRNGRPVPIGDPASKTGYVAFPLRPTKDDPEEKEVIEGIAFTMSISFDEKYRDDVEAALWAWETFGGVGARTRRGFGALSCFSVAENGRETDPRYEIANIKADLEADLDKYLAGEDFPAHLPHLSPASANRLKITNVLGGGAAVSIWVDLIEALQNFRHKRPQNKTKEGYPKPGRNRWPEPDAIRDKVKPHPRKYTDTIHNPPIDKAPRAAFGLPIIFEFKGERAMPNVTLKGADKDHDRFASPLIIRPLACQNDRCVGIALALSGSDVNDIPGGLVLDGVRDNPSISAQLTDDEAQRIAEKAKQINPNDSYNGDPDILQAFLATLKE